jgi:hypothetical protein
MRTQAPRGQYRVIGLSPIDTLTWPSGPLWKDCETLDEALDLADSNREFYTWVYVYNDADEILYEAGRKGQQLGRNEKLNQEPPRGTGSKR